jgi:hypothetical protein
MRVRGAVLAMIQKDRHDVRMSRKQAKQLGSTITAISDNSSYVAHG